MSVTHFSYIEILGIKKDKMSFNIQESNEWMLGLRIDFVKTTFIDPSWNTDQGV